MLGIYYSGAVGTMMLNTNMKQFIQFIAEATQPKFGTIIGTGPYRKPTSVEEVEQWAENHTQPHTYTIFDVIKLTNRPFAEFYAKPLMDRAILKESNEYLKEIIDAGLIPRGSNPAIIVLCEDDGKRYDQAGFIVDTQGAPYARYIALAIEDGEPTLHIDPPITPSRKDIRKFLDDKEETSWDLAARARMQRD